MTRRLRFFENEISKKAREIILHEVSKETEDHVALFLSGGMDSSTVLFALKEAGKRVTCYGITLENYISTDFSYARKNAKRWGCEFVPVFLPTDPETIFSNVKRIIHTYHLKKKTDIEVMYILDFLQRAVQENVIYTGFGGDDHFVISKRAVLHFRHFLEAQQQFRQEEYDGTEIQLSILRKMSKKRVECPLFCDELKALFWDKDWSELNLPHNKQVWINAFPEYFKHTHFHICNIYKGDTKLDKMFEILLKTHNPRGCKSVIGIYNDIRLGQI